MVVLAWIGYILLSTYRVELALALLIDTRQLIAHRSVLFQAIVIVRSRSRQTDRPARFPGMNNGDWA